MELRSKKVHEIIKQLTPPTKRNILTPLTPRIELTPVRVDVYTLNLDLAQGSCQKVKRNLFGKSLLDESTDEIEPIENNKIGSPVSEPYEDSGSEYVPSDEDIGVEDFHSANVCGVDEIAEDNINNIDILSHISETDKDQSTSEDFNPDSECEIIPKVRVDEKITRSKKQACFYCNKLVVQLPRHFELKHQGEIEVNKIMSLKKKDPERLKILDSLRKRGNFKYNSKILVTGGGNLVVKRRPHNVNKSASEYLPCTNCLGFYKKRALFRHMKYCDKKKDKKWSRIQATASALLPISKHASIALKERVLSIMTVDKITEVVKGDSLLLDYGSFLCEQFSNEDERHLNLHVSTKLREMGRFLLEARTLNKDVDNLRKLINPKYFDTTIIATKNIAGYDVDTGKYKIPSLASKIGHSLIKCSKILKAFAIRTQNNVLKKIVDDYVYLHQTEWDIKISRKARYTLNNNKYNKIQLLPLADDIRKLTLYLNEQEEKLSALLLKSFSYSKYLQLNELILTRLVLFNRKRVGEVQRIHVNSFENRNTLNSKSDIFQSLTEIEKSLAASFCHLETRGKKGRKVALLMSKSTENSILLLLNLRKQAKIPVVNPYLFATQRNYSVINGSNAFRKITSQCKLSNPESLRSTNLRKHVASMSQIMCLRQSEMDILANFMGHDPVIHREFYKLPDTSIHLAKLSKLLLAVQSGDVETYKGQNLDTLEVSAMDLDTSDNIITDKKSFLSNEKVKKPKEVGARRPWTEAEVNAIKKHLSHYMTTGELPGRNICEQCISLEPVLKNRDWKLIKYWVYNYSKKYAPKMK